VFNVYYLILAVGIVAGASSALFIQASTSPPGVVVATRLLLAAMMLTPVAIWAMKQDGRRWTLKSVVVPSLAGAFFLSVHLVTWTIGVRLTTVANASLIVNLMPVAMPFAMFFVMREKITRVEIVGSLLALAGVLILTIGKADFSIASLKGDIVCAGSMLLAVAYLVSTKMFAKGRPIWLHVTAVYWIGGLIALVLSVPEWGRLNTPGRFEMLMLLGLAVIPTVIGHSAMQLTMVKLRSQVVSTANLGQFVCAAIFGWLFFKQVPGVPFYLASLLIVAGAITVVLGSPKKTQRDIARAATQGEH
jgi:drug/metabolite transporter (DMT)-like permease